MYTFVSDLFSFSISQYQCEGTISQRACYCRTGQSWGQNSSLLCLCISQTSMEVGRGQWPLHRGTSGSIWDLTRAPSGPDVWLSVYVRGVAGCCRENNEILVWSVHWVGVFVYRHVCPRYVVMYLYSHRYIIEGSTLRVFSAGVFPGGSPIWYYQPTFFSATSLHSAHHVLLIVATVEVI